MKTQVIGWFLFLLLTGGIALISVLSREGRLVAGTIQSEVDTMETLLLKALKEGKETVEVGLGKKIRFTLISDAYRFPVQFTDEEWRKILTPDQYYILRKRGTERAFTGALYRNDQKGTYYSAATGQHLFSSSAKYESGSGWPSFWEPIETDAVRYRVDFDLGYPRIEVVDSLSGSHLGHVFGDGPAPTGLRYCINSAALLFMPEGGNSPLLRKGSQAGARGE